MTQSSFNVTLTDQTKLVFLWTRKNHHLHIQHDQTKFEISYFVSRNIVLRAPVYWYFDKIQGLCGRFSGDRALEFQTPEGVIVDGKRQEQQQLFGLTWMKETETCTTTGNTTNSFPQLLISSVDSFPFLKYNSM